MRILFTCLLTGIYLSGVGQTIRFDNCPLDSFQFYRAEIMPAFKNGNKALTKYVSNALTAANSDKTSGDLLLKIWISTNGSACLVELDKKRLATLDIDKLREEINAMPAWRTASQNNYTVGCFVLLEIMVEGGKTMYVNYKNNQP